MRLLSFDIGKTPENNLDSQENKQMHHGTIKILTQGTNAQAQITTFWTHEKMKHMKT